MPNVLSKNGNTTSHKKIEDKRQIFDFVIKHFLQKVCPHFVIKGE